MLPQLHCIIVCFGLNCCNYSYPFFITIEILCHGFISSSLISNDIISQISGHDLYNN